MVAIYDRGSNSPMYLNLRDLGDQVPFLLLLDRWTQREQFLYTLFHFKQQARYQTLQYGFNKK